MKKKSYYTILYPNGKIGLISGKAQTYDIAKFFAPGELTNQYRPVCIIKITFKDPNMRIPESYY